MRIAHVQVDKKLSFFYLNGSITFSIGVVMSEVLTIKQMPAELKQHWAEEARKNDRSMNKEVLRVLEEERARREAAKSPVKDMDSIMEAARQLQSFAVVDQRPMEVVLYDDDGMPK